MFARRLQAVCSRGARDGERAAWSRKGHSFEKMRERAEREYRPSPEDWPAFFVFYRLYWARAYDGAKRDKEEWLAKKARASAQAEAESNNTPEGWQIA